MNHTCANLLAAITFGFIVIAVSPSCAQDAGHVLGPKEKLAIVERTIRAMEKAYEYYLVNAEIDRANSELLSIVAYIRYQAALLDLPRESIVVGAGFSAAYWTFLQQQAAADQAAEKRNPQQDAPRGNPPVITCEPIGGGYSGCTQN